MPFKEEDVIQIYEWYRNLESRLQLIIDIMPVADKNSLTKVISPRVVPILIESCSILDSIMRVMVPAKFVRPSGKGATRRGANINDYCRELEPTLSLISCNTLVMTPMPFIMSPFNEWSVGGRGKMSWWQKNNQLKHERLKWSNTVTLLHAIEALCALHQLMTRIPHIVAMSFRFNWIELSGHNPEVLLERLPEEISSELQNFLAYTKLFCTPLSNQEWVRLEDIHPAYFKNFTRLMHFLGRMT